MTVSGKPNAAPGRVARAGMVLRDSISWPDAVQIARAAEEMDYRALFVPEITGRDAFATLTGFADATSRLSLGTGVVTMRARGPGTPALAPAPGQDTSGGRVGGGVCSGPPPGTAGARW